MSQATHFFDNGCPALQDLAENLTTRLTQAKRDVDAAKGSRHDALWQHVTACDGGPEAEEPWLDPSALTPPPSSGARGRGAGGGGGSGVVEGGDGGIGDDAEAAEQLLLRLGGDPDRHAGRAVSGGGAPADQRDGCELREDRAMLLQIEAKKELQARIAEKKARKAAAAALTTAAGEDRGIVLGDSHGDDDGSY
jgi:hypothetical protein